MWSKDKGVCIIAELSANHNNDYNICVETIKAIAESGADGVKIQTYTPDSLTLNIDNVFFGPKSDGPWKGLRPYDVFAQGAMPYEWQPKLKKLAEELGLIFFSSPFDCNAVDFLEKLNVPAYKIASFEITDIPLIKYVAGKGKPVIISTGVADIDDIELAIKTCKEANNNDITILKCTSQYPASIEDANLITLQDMKTRFGIKVGVSDHTMGEIVPIVAVSLGAEMVEKHFILDRTLGGPDAFFSMEPKEFTQMVQSVRAVEKSLGKVNYAVSPKDQLRRRSLFISDDMNKGDIFTAKNIRSVRPGDGLHPKYYKSILGCKVNRNISAGTPMSLDYIEKEKQ